MELKLWEGWSLLVPIEDPWKQNRHLDLLLLLVASNFMGSNSSENAFQSSLSKKVFQQNRLSSAPIAVEQQPKTIYRLCANCYTEILLRLPPDTHQFVE